MFLSLSTAIIVGAAIFMLSSITAKPIVELLSNNFELTFYTKNMVMKFFMLLYSIVAILAVNNGKLSDYGFSMSSNFKYGPFLLRTSGIILLSIIVGATLFVGILGHLFPTGNTAGFPEHKSIIEMIITVWIWSSLCEEVLVRGFVQGFIQKFHSIKLFRLSLPVWISGLFFGAMHLSLLKTGMGTWFVAFIVFNTTVIGLLAAHYREKTGSLIPAFWVHFLANVIGSIPLIIMMLIGK